MTKYEVTLELRTSLFTKILRFLRLKRKRETFCLSLNDGTFKKGDILNSGVDKL
jgi:hypothetical protein